MNNHYSEYTAKEIGNEYNSGILKILNENPIESSGLTICFDRKPDFFSKNDIRNFYAKHIGFFKGGKLCGFASIGFYNAYLMGKSNVAFYLSDAYVSKSARKKGFLNITSELLFKEAHRDSNWGFCIVLKGNKNAESYLAKENVDTPFSPYYKKVGTLDARNIIITFKKKESKNYHIRNATTHDIDIIISLLKEEFTNRLFAPFIDKEVFLENLVKRPDFNINNYYVAEKDGAVVGVCAAWDCKSFKQTRVLKYGWKLKFIRLVYLTLTGLFNFPPLPKQGNTFKDIYITDYAVKERDPLILNALLKKIYNDYRKLKYNTIVFGSYQSDLLLKALNGFSNQSIKSHIVGFSYDKSFLETVNEESEMPYVDVALL